MFVFFGSICLLSLEAQSENLQKTIREKDSPLAKSLSIKKPQPLPPGSHFKSKLPWPTFEEEDPAILGSSFNTMPKPLPPGGAYEPTLPWPTSLGTFSITSNYFFENTAQVIAPHTWGEKPVLKLMFGAMIRAAERWRAIKITDFERRQMAALREELNQEYETRNGLGKTPSTNANPEKISSGNQT